MKNEYLKWDPEESLDLMEIYDQSIEGANWGGCLKFYMPKICSISLLIHINATILGTIDIPLLC